MFNEREREMEKTSQPKICARCILPETFPGITFNAQGVCSHCRQFEGKSTKLGQDKKKYEEKFLDLLKSLGINSTGGLQRANSYDILMAYSGGKDSTYTMGLLKNKYKLRIVAVSFDNGFISETSINNIKRVTDRLGIDHVFFKPGWEILKKIFLAAAERELYAKKTLERASTICTSCIGLVKSLCLKMAIEQDIPMVGFGWSPGQAPVQSSIMKNNPSLIRMAQQAILNPMREIAGSGIETYFLREKHYSTPGRFPVNVHPMAWEFYNEGMIMEEIGKFGWTAPHDTDSNSTNCLLNAFANDIHVKRYGFHPYVWEIANMVREGVMDRAEGYEKIYSDQSPRLVEIAKHKLNAE
ncbi:MAG: hypothetical protein C4560_08150 [Nitrospiraceae bacterium]|nr:MAG: hypothetical protein C4560_08150 [Nitrospiraceae bacterium]